MAFSDRRYINEYNILFRVLTFAKPEYDNVLQPSLLPGSGCNTLSHLGLRLPFGLQHIITLRLQACQAAWQTLIHRKECFIRLMNNLYPLNIARPSEQYICSCMYQTQPFIRVWPSIESLFYLLLFFFIYILLFHYYRSKATFNKYLQSSSKRVRRLLDSKNQNRIYVSAR